ncbi:hypothetical protein Ccrd_003242 [Cynara cardunculus var. scolymus]|uniref:Sugar phosphate transporter domain-containing protein n=1 Tax=Cynara cardunculus var. scolymus TaxID=59895 RepID=A0A118JWG7_CYNCS|nr:hypothetical protein Ccrd_003242 [Cynara cardunculus var. scolymus]
MTLLTELLPCYPSLSHPCYTSLPISATLVLGKIVEDRRPPSSAVDRRDLTNSADYHSSLRSLTSFETDNSRRGAAFLVNVRFCVFLIEFDSFSVLALSVVLNLLLLISAITMKNVGDNETDVEDGRLDKERERSSKTSRLKLNNQALLSGLAYCLSSCSMILVNKYVLSSYDFNAGISLMLYQNFVSVVIVSSLSLLGVISTEPLTWRLIKVWLPVNFIFVGMLITSMFSLRYINVAMVTVLKNVTNVITAVGEMYLFNKHHDNRVWAALFLMIISAISGGITDLAFHAVGYTWQIINCFLTASYSLPFWKACSMFSEEVFTPATTFAHLDVTSVLSRGLAARGDYIQASKFFLLHLLAQVMDCLVAGVFFARAKIKDRTQS